MDTPHHLTARGIEMLDSQIDARRHLGIVRISMAPRDCHQMRPSSPSNSSIPRSIASWCIFCEDYAKAAGVHVHIHPVRKHRTLLWSHIRETGQTASMIVSMRARRLQQIDIPS